MEALPITLILVVTLILIRNFIAFHVRDKLIAEVYINRTQGDSSLEWSDLPSYNKVMFDLRVWKYKPIKEFKGFWYNK